MAQLSGLERVKYVRAMFARIARRYDLMNRLMSVGQDIAWRREVIWRADPPAEGRLLDLGAGTGDLVFEALRQRPDCLPVASDLTLEMMRVGRSRKRAQDSGETVLWCAADALHLPFPDGSFDAVVSGFLLRNVPDVRLAMAEQVRVLKPGGRLAALDTTRPRPSIFSPLVRLHLGLIIPFLGRLVTGQADAYRYLPDSTRGFLSAEQLAVRMLEAGLVEVSFQVRMLGTVAVHWGRKPHEAYRDAKPLKPPARTVKYEKRDLKKAALRGEPSYVWRAGQERRLKMILEGAGDRLKGRVLENGCGVGMYVKHLEPHAWQVVGLEFDYERARQAAINSPGIVNAAGERLPFPSDSFDAILSHEVLEHVQDDSAAVREMLRVLRPGGRLLIFTPNRGYPFETHGIFLRRRYRFGNIPLVNYLPRRLRNRLAPHVRVYTRRDMQRLFEGLPVVFVRQTVIFGAYDNIIARLPRLGRTLRSLLQWLEQTPLRWFGLSHFWVVEKRGDDGVFI